MIKFCKLVSGMMLAIVSMAVISSSTLFLKHRYEQAIETATEARLVDLGFRGGLKSPAPGSSEAITDRQALEPGTDASAAQSIIDVELSDASAAERDIWYEELKDRSPREIREILSLRRRFAPSVTLHNDGEFEFISGESPPPRTLPETIVAQATRIPADTLALIASSIEAVQTAEQVLLNNIANANTAGFKRSRVLFGDLSYRQMATPGQFDSQGRMTTTGVALGSGVMVAATQIDVSQGRLRYTNQPFDLAIQGNGYFQINDGHEFLYTRVGSFSTNASGQLVLVSKDRGRPLEPIVTIPLDTKRTAVSRDGLVSVLPAGQNDLNQIGNIQLFRFANPLGLIARGDNLFQQSSASGCPISSTPGQDGLGEIRQEYLEDSNVSIDDELAELRRLREQLQALRKLHDESSGAAQAR